MSAWSLPERLADLPHDADSAPPGTVASLSSLHHMAHADRLDSVRESRRRPSDPDADPFGLARLLPEPRPGRDAHFQSQELSLVAELMARPARQSARWSSRTTLEQAIGFLAQKPAGQHLLGSLITEFSMLEAHEMEAPAGAQALAEIGLRKTIFNGLNQVPAAAWSMALVNRIEQHCRQRRDSTAPLTVAGAIQHLQGAASLMQTASIGAAPPAEVPRTSSAVRKQVKDEVVAGFADWLKKPQPGDDPSALQNQHVLMGMLMDSLQRHQCPEVWKLDTVPGDEELDQLFQDIMSQLRNTEAGQASSEELDSLQACKLAPRMADTLVWMKDKFEEVPALRALPLNERWKLLGVEPHIIQKLGEECGLRTDNPLLGFTFDLAENDESDYANRMAKALWVGLQSEHRNLDGELSDLLHDLICGAGYDIDNVAYQGRANADGLKRMGDFMQKMKSWGIDSTLVLTERDECYFFDQKAVKSEYAPVPGQPALAAGRTLAEAQQLRDLLGSDPHARENFQFIRHDILPRSDAFERLRKLKTANLQVLQPLAQLGTANPEQTRDIASQVFLDGEQLHARANANYRLLAIVMANMVFARKGMPLSILPDAHKAESGSYAEVASMYRRGTLPSR